MISKPLPLFPPSLRLKETQTKSASLITPERLKEIFAGFLAQPRPPGASFNLANRELKLFSAFISPAAPSEKHLPFSTRAM
jgi:hypothetical protein